MNVGEAELLANDVAPDRLAPMRNVYLSPNVGSRQEAERIEALLSDGGQIFTPMQETFSCLAVQHARGQARHIREDHPPTA